uniref:UDENN domain-containing protein n=1 Tax=Anisakis simplex TaxID=6269 RepID=A0A0M3KI86_ANISI
LRKVSRCCVLVKKLRLSDFLFQSTTLENEEIPGDDGSQVGEDIDDKSDPEDTTVVEECTGETEKSSGTAGAEGIWCRLIGEIFRYPPSKPMALWQDGVPVEECTVYVDDESPFRFMPPCPKFEELPRGWFMLQDLVNALPLSIFALLVRMKSRVSFDFGHC